LADRVHLAPSSVADRVRRLEERGIIRGYAAQVDPAAFGRSVRAVIDVELPPGLDPADFEVLLAGRDEVALAKARHGNSVMMVSQPYGPSAGEVITIGSTDWVFGLEHDPAVGAVTSNVMRRGLAPRG
jgi:DNA-binding Lrp family transcriptional regulator